MPRGGANKDSPWAKHIAATKAKMPQGTHLKDILKEASKTYKK